MVLLQRADVARLSDTASGAPYFANDLVIRDSERLRRDYMEIMVVTSGRGRLVSYPGDGTPRAHRLRAGTMILFRPRDRVRFAAPEPDGISTLYVSFSEADWETFAGFIGLDPGWALAADPPMTTFEAEDPHLLGAFRTALERFRRAPTSLDLLQFLATVLPVLFPGYGRRHTGLGAPSWLVDGLDAMRDERNLRGGVPRLLELSHVSPSYLSVTVRRYYGTTPTAVISDLRLRRAALLLSTTTESIRTIATRCGFENVNYFSTAFRRAHHLPPREYRSRSRGGGLGTPR